MSDAHPSILFVHDQYPGQFGALAQFLLDQGWTVSFATLEKNLPHNADYKVLGYTPHRSPAAQTHPYAQAYDRAVLTGQACARSCVNAKDAGELTADVIISHTGPGAGLFLRDVFPEAFIVAYCEWWYHSPGIDTRYLAELQGTQPGKSLDYMIMARSRNASIAAELLTADQALCPTQFQADQFPDVLRSKVTVSHDGVDTAYYAPLPERTALGRPKNKVLAHIPQHAPIVTYATRGMEPHRCFPEVFKAFSQVAAQQKDVFFVIAGENEVFYGSDRDRQIDWLAQVRKAYPIAPSQLITPGTLAKSDYRWLLRRSSVHVYCTVPFVPSWSLIEAMSTGAPLIVSDVAPVREIVPDKCATFVDLLDPVALPHAIEKTLLPDKERGTFCKMARTAVRRKYSLSSQLDERLEWLMMGITSKNMLA